MCEPAQVGLVTGLDRDRDPPEPVFGVPVILCRKADHAIQEVALGAACVSIGQLVDDLARFGQPAFRYQSPDFGQSDGDRSAQAPGLESCLPPERRRDAANQQDKR